MRIVFYPDKNATNRRKHGVDFEDAQLVLYDPHALVLEDRDAQGEQRWLALGEDALGRVLVVVYAYREDDVRLISARKATKAQRKHYEENRRDAS